MSYITSISMQQRHALSELHLTSGETTRFVVAAATPPPNVAYILHSQI